MKKKQTNTEGKNQKSKDKVEKNRLNVLGCIRNTVPKNLRAELFLYDRVLTKMAQITYKGRYKESKKYNGVLGWYFFLHKYMCAFEDYITSELKNAKDTQSTPKDRRSPSYNEEDSPEELKAAPGMVLRALKVRLYPNKTQTEEINQILGVYRYVYNHTLWLKRKFYEDYRISLGLNELKFYFHNILRKDPNRPWIATINTKVLKQAIWQMLDAYEGFFVYHRGFPKFKRKTDEYTAHFPNEAISTRNTFFDRKISLTRNLSDLKFRCSREYHDYLRTYHKGIKSITLTRDKSGKYFLAILVELPKEKFAKHEKTGRQVGIDIGLKDQFITSDGQVYENKRFTKKTQKKITKLQKELSRKEKGSRNFEKSRKKLAKVYSRVRNQKEAHDYKVINELLSKYDVVFMEDLNVSGMRQCRNIAYSVSDVRPGGFKLKLVNKATLNDKRVVQVDRWFPSSKRCHQCGYVKKWLKMKQRIWTCPKCGKLHDRDYNASLNLLWEGKRILASDIKENKVRPLKSRDNKPGQTQSPERQTLHKRLVSKSSRHPGRFSL